VTKAEKFSLLIVNMVYSLCSARQHAMLLYAERDIVMANPSVRQSVHLSVRHTLVLYLNESSNSFHLLVEGNDTF